MTKTNRDMFYTMDEILEFTFLLYKNSTGILEENYITFLKARIGTHSVEFIGDDTLLEHPGAKAMDLC